LQRIATATFVSVTDVGISRLDVQLIFCKSGGNASTAFVVLDGADYYL
jgi:hypothetical protein